MKDMGALPIEADCGVLCVLLYCPLVYCTQRAKEDSEQFLKDKVEGPVPAKVYEQ